MQASAVGSGGNGVLDRLQLSDMIASSDTVVEPSCMCYYETKRCSVEQILAESAVEQKCGLLILVGSLIQPSLSILPLPTPSHVDTPRNLMLEVAFYDIDCPDKHCIQTG